MKSVVIFSGGMDSTVALYQWREFQGDVIALTFNYGSKHNAKEIECAKATCLKLGVEQVIFNLDLSCFKSSLLLGGDEIGAGKYDEDNIKKTVVPFRNGIMLSIAAGLGESLGCSEIVLGNHSNDFAVYPDCRPSFIESMNEAIGYGTFNPIRIKSPFCTKTKRGIALLGRAYGVDFKNTWSCYQGLEKHCGVCSTCLDRRVALEGFDETEYNSILR